MKYKCEFCGKEVKHVASTSMFGCYCLDCLELTIEECKAAIEEIEEEIFAEFKEGE